MVQTWRRYLSTSMMYMHRILTLLNSNVRFINHWYLRMTNQNVVSRSCIKGLWLYRNRLFFKKDFLGYGLILNEWANTLVERNRFEIFCYSATQNANDWIPLQINNVIINQVINYCGNIFFRKNCTKFNPQIMFQRHHIFKLYLRLFLNYLCIAQENYNIHSKRVGKKYYCYS